MDTRQTASVSIDGQTIRTIREEKRLTQLYVAKVVGVTTDTVSRWENNRYPSIRRDNALKLAEALEVDLLEILKQDEPVEQEASTGVTTVRRKLWPYLLAAALVMVGAVVALVQKHAPLPPKIDAVRYLPPYAAPGSRVLVRVALASEKPLRGMILRETYPKGWKLVASEPPASSLDNEVGKARWIFRNPALQKQFAYLLEVPKQAPLGSRIELRGELIANPDGQRTAVPLHSIGEMVVKPLHWADSNGNQVIDDLEILEVSDLLDDTGKLPLNWDLLEKLWDAGGYRWDAASSSFVPVRAAEAAVGTVTD